MPCPALFTMVVFVTKAPAGTPNMRMAASLVPGELHASLPEELVARGGFGTPTMFLDGDDMYFGNDRLVLLERALMTPRAC